MELMVDATDEDLLRSGDLDALVRRHYGAIFGLSRRLLRDEGDARDAAQETFARALARLASFDARRSFRTWLFAIAANLVRDRLRKRQQLRLDPESQDSLPDLSLPVLSSEDRERILAALDRLPFDWKIAVTLHYQQDLSAPEISEALGITVNAVRIRLYRALSALRKELS